MQRYIKTNMEMTSKERVMTALRHQETDRVPVGHGFGATIPVRKKLMTHLGLNTMRQVEDYLLKFSDIRYVAADYVGPNDLNKELNDGSRIDIWGVVRKPVYYGTEGGFYNEIDFYPLKQASSLKDLDQHRWPLPEWFNAVYLKDKIRSLNQGNEYAIRISNGNIFETSWYMRGFEQMMMDIILEPDFAWEIMNRVTDYYIGYFERLLQAADGMIDIVFTADDIGHQENLFMSLDMWETMIKPHHARLNRFLHNFGVKIMYHSDGAVMDAVPGLIDMGIDILEALQFDAKGMDPYILKEKYGNNLCFHGGVSVQKTLPYGTVQQVIGEVRERKQVLGKNGGYIIAPSHAIQAGTPPENIVAFLTEAAKK